MFNLVLLEYESSSFFITQVFENAVVGLLQLWKIGNFCKILMIKMSNILEIGKTSFSFSPNIL